MLNDNASHSGLGLRNRRGSDAANQSSASHSDWQVLDGRKFEEGYEASDASEHLSDDEGVDVGERAKGFDVLSDEDDVSSIDDGAVNEDSPSASVSSEAASRPRLVSDGSGDAAEAESADDEQSLSKRVANAFSHASSYPSMIEVSYCLLSVAAAVVAIWTLPAKPKENPVVGHLGALEKMVMGEDSDIASKLNMDYMWSMVYPDYQPPSTDKSESSISTVMATVAQGVMSSTPRMMTVIHAILCVVYILVKIALGFFRYK